MFDISKNYEISRKLAAQGMVLLKNEEKTLPLKKDERVGIIGKDCLEMIKGGGGSANILCEYVKSFGEGLQEKAVEGKIRLIDSTLKIAEEKNYDIVSLNKIAEQTDKVILTIRRQGTEGRDWEVKAGEYYLTEEELALLENVETSNIQNVILILNISNLMNLSFLARFSKIKAVLLAWLPGMECGSAVMDVLCGDVNPSGRLADTVALDYPDYPTALYFNYNKRETVYKEGIFVGYRFFETFAKEKVLYPFGYGLSYTCFDYTNYMLWEENGRINVSVEVTNIGENSGREVVQIYSSAPEGALSKPAIELKGYAKTKELMPLEKEIVQISFEVETLASYDSEGVSGYPAAWVLERGAYEIYVGRNVREKYFCGEYFVSETKVTEQLTNRFTGEPYQYHSELFTDEISFLTEKYSLYDVNDGKIDLVDFVKQLNVKELISLSLGQPIGFPAGTSGIGNLKKYGIPNPQTADGPVGVRRTVPTTCFPCSALIACSWDQELQYAMGVAMGYEGYSTGIDILLGPALNIHRDPLCGRNFEYYSEDPLLSGKTAAALVRGMQSEGLCATLKHFAANNCEYCRNINNSIVEERALREIYLKSFEIAVKESNPAYVMTAYNLLNGEHTSANIQLLRGVLRDEWKYEGAIMTDWRNGVSLVDEILAGNNIKMPFGYPDEGEKVYKSYQEGKIPLCMLRENAYYVVKSILKTRSFKTKDFGIIHQMKGNRMEIPIMEVNGLASSRIAHSVREDGEDYLWRLNREQRNQRSFIYYMIELPKEGDYRIMAEISTNCPETQIWFYDEEDKRLGTAFCRKAIDKSKWYTIEAVAKLKKGEQMLKIVFANEPYKEYEYFTAGPEIPNAWPEIAKEDISIAKLQLFYIGENY